MTITPASELDAVIGEVDSHAGTTHVAVITDRGPHTAGRPLVTIGGNLDRLRTEASFAALCGVAPVPVSGGRYWLTPLHMRRP